LRRLWKRDIYHREKMEWESTIPSNWQPLPVMHDHRRTTTKMICLANHADRNRTNDGWITIFVEKSFIWSSDLPIYQTSQSLSRWECLLSQNDEEISQYPSDDPKMNLPQRCMVWDRIAAIAHKNAPVCTTGWIPHILKMSNLRIIPSWFPIPIPIPIFQWVINRNWFVLLQSVIERLEKKSRGSRGRLHQRPQQPPVLEFWNVIGFCWSFFSAVWFWVDILTIIDICH
jgi:hypothetical protein